MKKPYISFVVDVPVITIKNIVSRYVREIALDSVRASIIKKSGYTLKQIEDMILNDSVFKKSIRKSLMKEATSSLEEAFDESCYSTNFLIPKKVASIFDKIKKMEADIEAAREVKNEKLELDYRIKMAKQLLTVNGYKVK